MTTRIAALPGIAAAALLLALVAPPSAAAESGPALRDKIDVHDDLVTLGDLFENAGSAAGVAVFRAPDLGTQGSVAAQRVAAAAERHGLRWSVPSDVEHVTVRRPSRRVDVDEVVELIRARLASEIGVADVEAVEVELDRNARPIHLDPRDRAPLTVKRLSFEPRSGALRAVVGLQDAERQTADYSFHGRGRETVAVAVPTRSIERGAVIRAGDVAVARIATTSLPRDTLLEEDALIGMSATRPLAADRPVRRHDLERPRVVQRNAHVAIVYSVPGLTLRVMGRALEDGATGDSVAVVNSHSNRTVHAEVTAPGEVKVKSGTAREVAGRTHRGRSASGARHIVR